jgi:hypothetical protein
MRVKLFKGQQKEFLVNVAKKTRLSPNEISRLIGTHNPKHLERYKKAFTILPNRYYSHF